MMKKTLAAATAAIGLLTAGSASATSFFGTQAEAFPTPATVSSPAPFAGRDDVNSVLTGPDATLNPDSGFYSLGFGGVVIVDFGAIVSGAITIDEITTMCTDPSGTCTGHPESVDVLVSDTYTWGSGDTTGFTKVGEIGNADAQNGATVNGSGRYIALLDTTVQGGGSFDGFDVDVVYVQQIPLPAAGWMLLTAIGGFFMAGRKRAA